MNRYNNLNQSVTALGFIIILMMFILPVSISALDRDELDNWLDEDFNMTNYLLEDTNTLLNGSKLYIAYHQIQKEDMYIGIFDKGILFTDNNGYFNWELAFNGPVIMNSNGNRPFDFSENHDLNLFGWEVSFFQEQGDEEFISVYIAPITDGGRGRPDSINMYYLEEYGQFVQAPPPWVVYDPFDVNEPYVVGIARYGMPDDDFEFLNNYLDSIKRLDSESLRLCRNSVFALYGYNFKNVELKDFFYDFNWYFPVPQDENNSIVLQDKHKKLVDYIISLEQDRSK